MFLSLLMSASFALASSHTVVMKSISFDPKVVTVKAGDTITWENKSLTDHSATADDLSFDTGMTAPKKSTKPVPFAKPGHYTYHCSLHGKTMSGVVEVTP